MLVALRNRLAVIEGISAAVNAAVISVAVYADLKTVAVYRIVDAVVIILGADGIAYALFRINAQCGVVHKIARKGVGGVLAVAAVPYQLCCEICRGRYAQRASVDLAACLNMQPFIGNCNVVFGFRNQHRCRC